MTNRITRLAPSPTGSLHLGNARTFLITWAIARQQGWQLLMRIEDLDGPRVKPQAAQSAIETLRWLGIDWDGDILTQSHDMEPYRRAMHQLAERGLIFACDLTRAQIEQAASAPHLNEHELRYSPELRPANVRSPDQVPEFSTAPRTHQALGRLDANYRLIVNDRFIEIQDHVLGSSRHNPAAEVGDFVLWTRRGMPSYQLAVVVDDARQGVTDVIRGSDLLSSAARQVLIYECLGLQPPSWWHLPLVLGPDGRRLAKRHGDTRIEAYRDAGVSPERIIGLIARWSGISDIPCELTSAEFLERFDLTRLPRVSVIFQESDHKWLLDRRNSL